MRVRELRHGEAREFPQGCAAWVLNIVAGMDHINGLCALWLLAGCGSGRRCPGKAVWEDREAWVLSRGLLCPVARNRPYPFIALLKATAPVGGPCQVPANAPHCSQPERSVLFIFLHSAHTFVRGVICFLQASILIKQADSTPEICTQIF